MSDPRSVVRRILVVGAGAPAWLAAASIARLVASMSCSIDVLEVLDATSPCASCTTLPSFQRLLALLEVDERALVARTAATFHLGCSFVDWDRPGSRYFHGFGPVGARLDPSPFHQHWLRLREHGEAGDWDEHSVAAVAARSERFARPSTDPRSVLSLMEYGFQVDGGRLAALLQDFATSRGVASIGSVATLEAELGTDERVVALQLDDGRRCAADLYIDCTPGARLLPRPVGGGFIDWSSWLPCDRVIGGTARLVDDPPPFTVAHAAPAGWLGRLHPRGRLDISYTYASRYEDDASARRRLEAMAPTGLSGSERTLDLLAGRPVAFWSGNCLRLPGAGIDALEGSALHLVQTGIARFLTLFPSSQMSTPDADEYNRQTSEEYDRIRDLLIAHYALSGREEPFWRDRREVELPPLLRHKLDLFRQSGRLATADPDHFTESSWVTVLLGQGLLPAAHDPLADLADRQQVAVSLKQMRAAIAHSVDALPSHGDFLRMMTRESAGTSP